MKPRGWRRNALWLLALVGALVLRAESTPAAAVFSPGDSEDAAFQKINALRISQPLEAMVRFQLACRDFCRRFPVGKHYYEVRKESVIYWTMPTIERLRAKTEIRPKLEDWDPVDAERDSKLDAEQRAGIAMLLANDRANMNRGWDWGKTWEEKQFDAVVAALPLHRATKEARDSLIDDALHLPPERAGKAIAVVRENYPDDQRAKTCIALLKQLGEPCEVRFTAMDGRVVDLRDYRGKVVLLEFWSKYCAPCIAAIPDLKKLDERYGARGFAIIGVNTDTKRTDAEEIVNKYALPWPQFFDGGGWHAALADRFLVSSIPRGVLIDSKGRLRALECDARHNQAGKLIESLLPR